MSKTKKYKILKPKNKTNQYDEKILIRFIFNEQSEFPGIVVDLNWFNFKENAEDPTKNCELKYSIVKLPKKRKYDNLDNDAKQRFEKEVGDVFLDIFSSAFKLMQSRIPLKPDEETKA